MNDYLTSQIITYMGNKRKLLDHISNVIDIIKKELKGNDNLVIADAFSGSGIVARLLKLKSKTLYVNDISGYSFTLNQCFLSNPTKEDLDNIKTLIDKANKFAYSKGDKGVPKWIRCHWSPNGEITKDDRVYFTEKNGLLIDKYMYFIKTHSYPKKYECFLLAQLLVKCSIHNNTNGQFSAFYKDENGIGKYGGKKEIDLKRITKDIKLDIPVLMPNTCNAIVSRLDVLDWLDTLPPLDIIYLDPPYNKHPYSVYYFILDIINDWDINQEIPKTNRGQPKDWKRSDYNSVINAEKSFTKLIEKVKTKYIVLSYNNKGIIPITNLEKILEKRGTVYRYPVEHKTYNKLKGIANYKRTNDYEDVKEYIWMVHVTK